MTAAFAAAMAVAMQDSSTHAETITQIRDTIARVCEEFPGEYWRERDREREYPEAFVNRLTELGLPCPNIFCGMQEIHGPLEWA